MEQLYRPEPGGNALLDSFPAAIQHRLNITTRHHKGHDVLIKADKATELVYFPHRGAVISMTRSGDSGATVEVGIVGSEGMANVQSLLTPGPSGSDAVVQIAGDISQARLADVRTLLSDTVVRDLLLASVGSFLAQVSQHVVCNRLHSIEQRLAKWLLGVRDRIDTDQIDLTHDFLSRMLGARRAGVTVAVGALALDGIVIHERSSITIADRESLEDRACECYGVIRDATQQQQQMTAYALRG